MVVLNMLHCISLFTCLVSYCTCVLAQSETCKQEKIFRALQAQYENGSDIFCQEYLAKIEYVGTLREDPTLFYYETVTNRKSTEVVYVVTSTTTKEVVTSTSFSSQKRTGQDFTMPLPSYVQQYPRDRVSKAW